MVDGDREWFCTWKGCSNEHHGCKVQFHRALLAVAGAFVGVVTLLLPALVSATSYY
jgi:hypothetical protein